MFAIGSGTAGGHSGAACGGVATTVKFNVAAESPTTKTTADTAKDTAIIANNTYFIFVKKSPLFLE